MLKDPKKSDRFNDDCLEGATIESAEESAGDDADSNESKDNNDD